MGLVAMEFDVTPVFPTLIGRFRVPDADAMNQDLQALILARIGRGYFISRCKQRRNTRSGLLLQLQYGVSPQRIAVIPGASSKGTTILVT